MAMICYDFFTGLWKAHKPLSGTHYNAIHFFERIQIQTEYCLQMLKKIMIHHKNHENLRSIPFAGHGGRFTEIPGKYPCSLKYNTLLPVYLYIHGGATDDTGRNDN